MAMNTAQTQNEEFRTLTELARIWTDLQSVPVVDDDYPYFRSRYEGALHHFLISAANNGRKVEFYNEPASNIKTEFNPIYLDVRSELESALAKFPPFNSAHEGWAIIKEELDELWEVVRLNQSTAERNEKLRKECIQVAAMAMRFLLEMNHFKN